MNFLTAEVQIVVDYGKLSAQLAKVKQEVLKSTLVMEKSYHKQNKVIEVVNKSLVATAIFTRKIFGQTIKVEKVLGRWSTHAWNIYRKMVRNYEIFKKILITTGNIALTLGKGTVWSIRAIGKALKDLVWPMEKIKNSAKEINEGFRVWSISDILLHPIEAVKEAWENFLDEGQKGQTEWNDHLQETAERLADINEKMSSAKRTLPKWAQTFHFEAEEIPLPKADPSQGYEAVRERYEEYKRTMKEAQDELDKPGQTMQMVLFGVPGMFTKIYDAAKWAFEGIADIATSVFQRIFDTSIWFKTGVIAAFVGMYYKITQAAMDAEDALSFNELGATRTSLKRFKDALTGVLAALGKPFLSGIQTVSTALAEWLEKSTPKITAWADKFAKKLEWLRNAFVDWVVFLTTDFRGGIDIALQVILELFKTFGAILVISVKDIGYKVGKALVTGIAEGLKYVVESSLDKVKRIINAEIENISPLLTVGISAFPPRGDVPYVRKEARPSKVETPEGKIEQRLKEGLVKIEKILADMPTWGDTEAAAAKKNKPIIMAEISAMEEHRRKMLEQGATLSDSQWAIQIERMIAESEFAADKLKKAQDFAATRQKMLNTLDFEYDLLGRTNDERERATELANFQAELAKDVSLSLERQNELMDEYALKLDRLIEKQSSLGHIVQLWMNKAGEMGKNLGNLLTSTFDRMADSLADALMGMEMDWKAFGRMFIKQLLAMIIKLQIAFALQTAMGMSSTGMATAPSGLSYIPAGAGPGGLQHGGEVLETGLAKVHKGEVFSGVNNEMGFGGIIVNNYVSDAVDVEVMDDERVINITKRASIQMAATDGEYRQAHKIGGR